MSDQIHVSILLQGWGAAQADQAMHHGLSNIWAPKGLNRACLSIFCHTYCVLCMHSLSSLVLCYVLECNS